MISNDLTLKKYNNLVLTSYYKKLKLSFFSINLLLYVFLYSIMTGVIWPYLIYGSIFEFKHYIFLFFIQFLILGPIFYIFLNNMFYISNKINKISFAQSIFISTLFPGVLSPIFGFFISLFRINNYLKNKNLMLNINENSNPDNLLLETYVYNDSINLNDYLKNKYILSESEIINNNKKNFEKGIKFQLFIVSILIIFIIIMFIFYI